jgi:rare lipoprotein A
MSSFNKIPMRYLFFILFTPLVLSFWKVSSGTLPGLATASIAKEQGKKKIYYGIASYYADKFIGRPTASGELYSHKKLTAACNILPLGTWLKVTNLRNNKVVIVKTNDRLHVSMKRVVDLSKSAAETLGYTKRGLTQVKIEVIEKSKM